MQLGSVDTNLVIALRSLLRHQQVTRAAREVGLSQSSMSHALARLRAHFADPLLVPAGRALVLTERGKGLLEPVATAVAALERVFARPEPFDPRTSRRVFQIAATDNLELYVLPHLAATVANLVALNNWQGGCERIKQTPMPRQYDFFTRLFLWVFFLLLPSSLIGLFAPGTASWPMIRLAGLIALVYATVSRAGQVIEDPFENKLQDVPMTALCIAVERDLREQLGKTDLPPAAVAVDGFLM